VNPNIWQENLPAPTWHKKVRIWLSRNSVIYQLLVHGALFGPLKGKIQIENARQLNDGATSLIIPEKNISEAFLPRSMLSRLDQESPAVRDGMRITFTLLAEMNDICLENKIKFLVAVIPTKEMVFSDYLENNSGIPLNDVMTKLLSNERLAWARTRTFLTDSSILYVDTLPRLKRSVEQGLYARSAADMHPNRNGYKVIADAVFEALQH
jgi:hypothetical protein